MIHGYSQDAPDPPMEGDRPEFVTCPTCDGEGGRYEPRSGLHGDPGELREVVCASCGGDGCVSEDRLVEIAEEIAAEQAYMDDLAAERRREDRGL